jgi:hypothetical protein
MAMVVNEDGTLHWLPVQSDNISDEEATRLAILVSQ